MRTAQGLPSVELNGHSRATVNTVADLLEKNTYWFRSCPGTEKRQRDRRALSWTFAVVAGVTMAFTACGKHHDPAQAPYLSLGEVEATYGPLITAGNHPTPDQNGTGERVGLFQDASGTVWGLPLSVTTSGGVLACAPPALHDQKVTDTFPAGSTIIGSTNEPTGWRGGTGNLEVLIRDRRGIIRWQAVRGAQLTTGPLCWVPESPGQPQQLNYYRLEPSRDSIK